MWDLKGIVAFANIRTCCESIASKIQPLYDSQILNCPILGRALICIGSLEPC